MEINKERIIEDFAECSEEIINNYVDWKCYQWECKHQGETTPKQIKGKFIDEIYLMLWDNNKE